MKASVVDGYPKGNKMKILIEDAEASQVNALRRAIMADVPKMAISKVMFTLGVNQDNNRGEIYESVNALPDEVIAHRLAMVPIPTAIDEGMAFPDECENCMDLAEDDKGCPSCQVLYTLNVQGPSSDSDEPYRVVRAGDDRGRVDPGRAPPRAERVPRRHRLRCGRGGARRTEPADGSAYADSAR